MLVGSTEAVLFTKYRRRDFVSLISVLYCHFLMVASLSEIGAALKERVNGDSCLCLKRMYVPIMFVICEENCFLLNLAANIFTAKIK